MNNMGADRALIRAKDVALLVSILTLGGLVWGMYKKPAEWDQATKEINELRPRVESLEKAIIANSERYGYIVKQLDAIDRKVGR